MSLRTYEEARPWARSIRARVESRQMPPWHIDRTVGIQQFKNDRSLSDDQIATVLAWVDQGAVKGDPKDMPAAIQWPEGQGWNYAARFGQKEPDLIIRNQPWTMKAGAGQHLVQADGRDRRDRAALGARDRSAARYGEGSQDHASRERRDRPGRTRRDA